MPAEPHYPSLSIERRIWNSRSSCVGSARRPSCRRCLEAALAGSACFCSLSAPPVRHGALALIS
jgi:hypothetical protein